MKLPFTNWDGSEDSRRSTHYTKETVARTYVFFGLGAPAPEAYRGQNNETMPSVCLLFWAWPVSLPILTLALGISAAAGRGRVEFCFVVGETGSYAFFFHSAVVVG